jgi:hypothetical protein
MASRRLGAVLVGDNPFLGVSHYSGERARNRPGRPTDPALASNILVTALQNGANGFLFSVAETSLSVLGLASQRQDCPRCGLYAILPYSYEYVRLAVSRGGIPGLVKEVAQQLLASRNVPAVLVGAKGAIAADPSALCEAYVRYDANRVRAAMGPAATFEGVLLHEIVADMALGLGWDWLFRAFIQAGARAGVQPGFNTRNLPLLVAKLREWGIPTRDLIFAAPFNGTPS